MSLRVLAKNIPYLWTQSSALLGNTSIGVKTICLIVCIMYWFSYSESAILSLSVTPGFFLPPRFWVWTALTHCFLEIHFWEVAIDVVTLLLVGKLLEPLWGAMEMLIFFFVVNCGVAFASAIFYYFLYMVTFNDELLFQVHIHGLAGYIAGVTVAVKQVMPDHILWRSPVGKLTNRNVPLCVFLMSFVLWAVGAVEGSYCTMFGSGLVIGWIYLRFYQIHSNGSRGDMADSFGFPSFFPNVLQPPLALICNAIFGLLVKIKVCKKPVRKYDVGSANSISLSLPGTESHDTERRRQIALKALSERLSKAETNASMTSAASSSPSVSTAWPSLEKRAHSPQTTSTTTPSAAEVHIPIGDAASSTTVDDNLSKSQQQQLIEIEKSPTSVTSSENNV